MNDMCALHRSPSPPHSTPTHIHTPASHHHHHRHHQHSLSFRIFSRQICKYYSQVSRTGHKRNTHEILGGKERAYESRARLLRLGFFVLVSSLAVNLLSLPGMTMVTPTAATKGKQTKSTFVCGTCLGLSCLMSLYAVFKFDLL